MPDERLLSRLDLNLLVALDALLTERNVTRAAARLQLSQPSLSASLGKLRRHFDDQLLARRGNTYELTPLAVRLAEHTTVALDATRRVFESQSRWDPTESEREFIIHCSDYSLATIAPRVTRIAHQQAPNVRMHFVPSSPETMDEVLLRLPSIDALVLPHGVVSELPHQDVIRDDWVAIASTGNERVADGLTMEVLSESPWVFTYRTRFAFTSVGRQLEQLGVNPWIDAVAESFVMLPLFVEHTERLAIIQRHLSPLAQRMGDVQVLELPFNAVPLLNALWWHPVHQPDPEHRWLREVFAAARVGFGEDEDAATGERP
ncbi:LysR family transcriptional regulator [Citricoccus muralis]|uniref:DNA-binding transcriptional LysR family regulator n=1 Tax=Citricoccus muralis TaxID=169134 RepID=A0A3D9LDD0_9MICC|nr:LysR family transcriptional regulator [Citricoccus muralis]REE04235.1 DNA-binding transcriptional LysR family regulator [Citricoccus muralis]